LNLRLSKSEFQIKREFDESKMKTKQFFMMYYSVMVKPTPLIQYSFTALRCRMQMTVFFVRHENAAPGEPPKIFF